MFSDSDIEHDAATASSTTDQSRYDSEHNISVAKNIMPEHKGPICTSTPMVPFDKSQYQTHRNTSHSYLSSLGNPTPLALIGFLMALTPLSNILLGWRESGGMGAAGIGVFYSFGSLLMLVGSLLEFCTGNTFSFVVFGTYGGCWLAQAIDMTPSFNAAGAYGTEGSSTPMYNATSGFFTLYMGLATMVFVVASFRTNICLLLILVCLAIHFSTLTACYWLIAEGKGDVAIHTQHAAGGAAFSACLVGWYLFVVQIFASVEFPLNLPIGELGGVLKGYERPERRLKRRLCMRWKS